MENENTYQCEECTNKGTPICQVCVTLSSPSGRIRRPSEFVQSVVPEMPLPRLRANLAAALISGTSLRISHVLAYNELIAAESEGR